VPDGEGQWGVSARGLGPIGGECRAMRANGG